MASFLNSVRQFGRGSNKNNDKDNKDNRDGKDNATNASPSAYQPPHSPYPPNSPAFPQSTSVVPQPEEEKVKYFFQEKYAPLNVKGNFLTLCACPKNVELGEWIAHQVVEQYRLLKGMLQVIQETNLKTGMPICNENSCPTMNAGDITYTWLVDGNPAKISAPKFINRVERWIVSKIHDPVTFPTSKTPNVPLTYTFSEFMNGGVANTAEEWIGKSSNFPQTFYRDCQGIMRQMFRCYAHLYHAHWEDPFYHLNKHEILNMCFVHFVTVAKYYRLVADKDMEPLQPLIDIYVRLEKIPPEALAGHWASQPSQSSSSSTSN
ncbi:hypothetical protein VTO42DRAFT_6470 [Malbranchea cinnamomea]